MHHDLSMWTTVIVTDPRAIQVDIPSGEGLSARAADERGDAEVPAAHSTPAAWVNLLVRRPAPLGEDPGRIMASLGVHLATPVARELWSALGRALHLLDVAQAGQASPAGTASAQGTQRKQDGGIQ